MKIAHINQNQKTQILNLKIDLEHSKNCNSNFNVNSSGNSKVVDKCENCKADNETLKTTISPLIQSILLTPDHIDDIYALYNFIESTDRIKSRTSRKITIGSKQVKVSLGMEIMVEKSSVDLQCGVLTLSGKITNVYDSNYCDKIRIGSSHSLCVGIDDCVRVGKVSWSIKSFEALRNILNKEEYLVFVCFDGSVETFKVVFDDACVDNGPGYKYFRMKNLKADECDKNEKVVVIDCGGDIEFKSHFKICRVIRVDKNQVYKNSYKNGKKDKNKKNNSKKNNKGDNAQSIIEYVLTNYTISNNPRPAKKVDLKDLFHKNEPLQIFGINEIYDALEYGALRAILVQKEVFKSFDVEMRKNIEVLKKEVEKVNADFFIVGRNDEFWDKLSELGGVVGILKFNYK